MSGVVRGVKNLLRGGSSSAPAQPAAQASATPATPKPRAATADEAVMALRRRRGSRTLLSQERMDAEAGLAGEQNTLGGM
jgi:hypothetical protein